MSIPLGLSREKIWREKLFLGLVQIESKVHRLISICTKPRKSFSRQILSLDKPSGIDNRETMAVQSLLPEKRWQGACVRREGSRCEKTEAAIKKPIAAPALTLSGTRPPLRNLCVLPAVRAAVGGFLRRRGALCAGRCTLGRLFGLRGAARPRAR